MLRSFALRATRHGPTTPAAALANASLLLSSSNRRIQPAVSAVIRCRGMAALAGTVKFYLRDKGYGFIQPDQNPDTDVFVHRNNISCTHTIPKEVLEYSQRYPYLKKDERVLFELDYEQATGLRKAFNVTWLNGSKIPPERTNFLGGVHERAKGILGINLYKLLEQQASSSTSASTSTPVVDTAAVVVLDDAALLKRVRQEFREAQISIQSGEEIVRRLGMSVSEFPTIKCRTGRPGKYIFADDQPPDDNMRFDVATSTDELLDNLEIPSAKLRDYSKEEFDDLPDFDKLPDDKPNSYEADDEYVLGEDDDDDDDKEDGEEEEDGKGKGTKKIKPIDDTVWKL
jgi:'Cold-shock' DNA-binding domain